MTKSIPKTNFFMTLQPFFHSILCNIWGIYFVVAGLNLCNSVIREQYFQKEWYTIIIYFKVSIIIALRMYM